MKSGRVEGNEKNIQFSVRKAPFSSQMFTVSTLGTFPPPPQQQILNTPCKAEKPPQLPSELRTSTLIKPYQNCRWYNPNCLEQRRILERAAVMTEEKENAWPRTCFWKWDLPKVLQVRHPEFDSHILSKNPNEVYSCLFCPLRLLVWLPYAIYWPRPVKDALRRTLVLGKRLC